MSDCDRSIALIRHPVRLEQLWLAIWNPRLDAWDFVTAERLQDESFRECLDREIAWTLPLRRGKDYLISSVARLHLPLPPDPPATDEDSSGAVEFYIVDFYGPASQTEFTRDEGMCWLSGSELLAGQDNLGTPIAAPLVQLLRKADVIRQHQDPSI